MLKFFASVIIMFSLPFYTITEMLFRVFFVLAEGELVSPDKYELLISNFYVILGVVLLFVLSFSLLKMMVNPEEKKGTESTKKIIINLITSTVIMVLLPTIFTFAFDLQTSVIGSEYNVLGKLFGFGASNTEVVDGEKSNVKQAAATITNSIFTAFFNVDVNYCENEINSDTDLETCQKSIMDNNNEKTFFEVIDDVNQSGELIKYKNFSEAWTDQKIEYNVLLSIICGAILIYVVASFCIDMAIRLVKLVFYQLIAPIPLFFRVVPDTKLSNSFNQWVKATLATYFEVYIRIIIVYFVLYLCLQIEGLDILKFIGGEIGVFGRLVAKALIFIGLITFMRQAPKLISEVTGIDSSNIKLGIKEKLKDGGFFAAANAAGSLIAGKGNPLAAIRGAKYGWNNANLKGIGAEAQRRREYEDFKSQEGADWKMLAMNYLRNAVGLDTTADAELRKIEDEPELVKNRTSSDIKGIHFGEDGKLYEGSVFDNNGNVLTYENGKYLDENKNEYNGQLFSSDGKKLYNIIGNKGAYYDENNNRYSGLLFSEDGKVVSYNHDKNKYVFEDGSIYEGQLFTNDNRKLNGIATQEIMIDSRVTSILESLEAERIKNMSNANVEINSLESQIAYGDAQITFKSNVKGEAEKKVLEEGSEVKYTYNYEIINDEGNVENKSFTGSYDQIKEFANSTLISQGIQVDLDKVKDAMIEQYIAQEAKKNSSKIKQDIRAGLDTIVNNGGYEYQYTTKEIKDGKEVEVIKTARVDIVKDESTGKYTISELKDGKQETILAAQDANWEDNIYKFISKLDKSAKDSNGILKSRKQNIQETIIDGFKGQNDATSNLNKQAQESKDAKKKSQEQKTREAAKKYTANRGK